MPLGARALDGVEGGCAIRSGLDMKTPGAYITYHFSPCHSQIHLPVKTLWDPLTTCRIVANTRHIDPPIFFQWLSFSQVNQSHFPKFYPSLGNDPLPIFPTRHPKATGLWDPPAICHNNQTYGLSPPLVMGNRPLEEGEDIHFGA